MSELPMRSYAASLSIALAATFQTFVPAQAEAATGLFSVARTLYSDVVGHANQTKTVSFPTASGYVGTTSPPRFTVPQSVIKDTTGFAACFPGICRAGYPESKAWYSYWNLRGGFRPNNPYGATMTTTVRFPTTLGNTGPPLGSGEPVTPTTTFSGRYDFKRGGSIMITPGPNHFGGTMRFFYGPNQRYYQLITINSTYIAKAYGSGQPMISTGLESHVGEFVIGPLMNRYFMTGSGYYRLTTGTLPHSPGDYYARRVQYISTIVPFTTGMITAYQPLVHTTTVHTLTGYDNRTPAGLNGVISLVRPRLVHAYNTPFDANEPIRMTWATASSWQFNFHFLPEPGVTAMVISGISMLAGVCRLRGK